MRAMTHEEKKEYWRQQSKKYYARNKATKIAAVKKYQSENRKKILAYIEKWQESHPEKVRAYLRKYSKKQYAIKVQQKKLR